MAYDRLPAKQGLYDPAFEHDACGIGFIANIKGIRSHDLVRNALEILRRLTHRGGQGADPESGDGAGILTQIPHALFVRWAEQTGIALPEAGRYGVGMLFLPQDEAVRRQMELDLETIVNEEGLAVLAWRTVPVDERFLGESARRTQPHIRQIFIGDRNPAAVGADDLALERRLYVVRKQAERKIGAAAHADGHRFYFAGLSARTIVYKGLLLPEQLPGFYKDLSHPLYESALALVHSRFSTNTFPSWERAHPNRCSIHNGEINTIKGNVNWMLAREAKLSGRRFPDMAKIRPIIDAEGSDSSMLDNCLEFLHLSGRPLAHAVMMMVPEPWEKHPEMSEDVKAFYEYHSCLMEPWDGPAALAFSDGRQIGACLDRNGLRPARYYVTSDDFIIFSSEVGVVDLPPEQIVCKQRLHPGQILLVDTEQGRIIPNEEIKQKAAAERPYREWLDSGLVDLDRLPEPDPVQKETADWSPERLTRAQLAFGYTYEELNKLLLPLAVHGEDPVGSMGYDAPLAVLSDRPQLLYNYFKQMFAQVTNPPIDAFLEELVASIRVTVGAEGHLLEPGPEHCRRIRLKGPVLTDAELARIKACRSPGLQAAVLPMLFPAAEGAAGLEPALQQLFRAAEQAVADGASLLILSDRGMNAEQAPIPALLAVSALHHELIRRGKRTDVSLLVESGEPREVHHIALLLGYGASAVNPYLAFASIRRMSADGLLGEITPEQAEENYVKGIHKGLLKVIAKMGISTVQSYIGAQIFEAVGLAPELIDRYFPKTPSRIGGIGLAWVAGETLARHARGFEATSEAAALAPGDDFQWRPDGDAHLFTPQTIHALQQACIQNDYRLYKEYSRLIDAPSDKPIHLRGLLEFSSGRRPVPLDEVEPAEAILRRFKSGAMSYGSISKEAHETLAIAMNRIGGKSNSGEGGEDPERYLPDANGDLRNSAVKQVASGRFGVTSHYLIHAEEIQIKMAQGAKPGEGGQLPAHKVYPWIAKARGSTPGVELISPPPHHDIYSIEDLAELIYDLKNANPQARIGVKLVAEAGVGTIAAGVAKAKADVILISGYDGGTGAAARSSIRHAGIPWEIGLAEAHQTLVLNGLRNRVRLETDGKMMTGRDVVVAAMLGAEEFAFATLPLVAMGCIMMRVCHLDTCPVGIATQNPELRAKFAGKPEYVERFMRFVAQDVREWMARLGVRSLDELIGRTDFLRQRAVDPQKKAATVDLSALLHLPVEMPVNPETLRGSGAQQHGLEQTVDHEKLLPLCRSVLNGFGEKKVQAILPIRNTDRAAGTMLGSEVTRLYGIDGLPEDSIQLRFHGSAGQSFGAFSPRGVTLTLEGDANDYVGKGLSGGKIIVYPPAKTTFAPERNIIVGNVAFYGATSGEAYIRGAAGERFCVRNSGADVVVEGVGNHGCEYMTGGRVVILGEIGLNFAAGMSGGVAYVWNERECPLDKRVNRKLVDLEPLDHAEEIAVVRSMIERHAEYTGSARAEHLLHRWKQAVGRFVRIIPRDYKRVMQLVERFRQTGISREEAMLAAFQQRKKA